ncbi:S-layer homology domain-containing protein [Helicovermis profundi]|uniref:SLH domain-containing protein n=1 Tax=Helicovermis profundi TaxID=3065157 RepID=A0AAU9EV31_9FIRM|nr:hypothetical protein HLPR_26410 [Clostridia bacterium S502]
MYKKSISLTMILMLLLTFSAFTFASKTTGDEAIDLNRLNLLRGDGNSYNLDGKLKRSEAAAFIVRLLGVENEVLGNKYKYINTGFADVDSALWYAPYIGYCKANGIINGFPDGEFKPDNNLSEKAFFTMTLKALGYTDFDWNNVNSKAYDVGLIKDITYAVKTDDNTNYLRGNVVDVLYNSLKINIKGTYKTAIDRLIDNNVVSSSLASDLNLLKVDTLKTKIVSVKAKSLNNIEIVLNEKLSKLEKDQILVYEKGNKEKTLDIKSIKLSDKTISIETSSQEKDKDYLVDLSNIVDIDTNIVKLISSEFTAYSAPIVKSDYFKISKVEAISKSQIDVYFTQPININAELPLYYSLYQDGKEIVDGTFKNISSSVLGSVKSGVSIRLKNKFMTSGTPYVLKIKGDLASVYGTKLDSGDGEEFSFIGNGNENTSLKIISVKPISKNYVRILFNEDVDKTSAMNSSNYSLKDLKNNIVYSSAFDVVMDGIGEASKRQVDVKWLSFIKDREYEMTIDGVTDRFGASTIEEEKHGFAVSSTESDPISIDYASAVNRSKILVYFNRPVLSSSVNLSIAGVSKKTALFDASKPYLLTIYLSSPISSSSDTNISIVSGIKDSYGVSQSGTLTYVIKKTSSEFGNISAIDARFISEDKVKVSFSEEIYNSINSSQFKLSYTDKDDHKQYINANSVHVYNNKEAIVTFTGASSNENYKIEITNLKDYSNQFTTSSIERSVFREK